jgi:class 3 adenylate cyclase
MGAPFWSRPALQRNETAPPRNRKRRRPPIAEQLRSLGLAVRSGLHIGEIELQPGDIGGIAVHIAARVAAGETIVSSTVRDLVAGSGLRFDDRGLRDLKGLPEPVRLYSVLAAA